MTSNGLFHGLAALAAALPLAAAHAHGSMIDPPSRVYYCTTGNIENPQDPACAAAIQAGGTQAFYDWMGINQANANGNHQAVVPDGTLCSGNNPEFHALNLLRSDWHATPIAPNPQGHYGFVFKGTAPHATRDWIMYVTRDGHDPLQPLRWSDLDEFCRRGNVPLDTGNLYHLDCPLPVRRGRHVIYNVWQRSDSTEAFYTCIDVDFGAGGDVIFRNGFQP